MHCVVVVEFVAELGVQLGEETIFDEGGGRGVDAWFALWWGVC